MKKISIIIPYHSYPHYLKECLTSLKVSAFQDFETLLVVDADGQGAPEFVQDYDVTVISCTKKGVAACRNEGIKHAQGEYIYFLDADDYVLEHTLGDLAQQMNGQDLVFGVIRHTWNNKANFLDKQAKKEIDEEELEEKEQLRQDKLENYLDTVPNNISQDQAIAIYYLLRGRKGIKNITALSIAYKRSFIQAYDFHFNEDFRYFSDMTFLCPILEKVQSATRVETAEYVKRKHNDPINCPALDQEDDDDRFDMRCRAVAHTRTLIDPQGWVRNFLDRKLLYYFNHTMVKKLRRSKDDIWRKQHFYTIIPYIEDCVPEALDSLNHRQTKAVTALINGDLKGVQRQTRWILGRKKLKSMFKNKNTAYKLAYYHRYLKQPINDKVILFESFMAKNYSDSPKYIYEYIAQNYPEYTCVWAINNGSKVPYGAKCIKRFSFSYAYYLATAKYLVFNVRTPLWYRKREGQVFLETWHGTPLKRLVFDQEEVTSASPKYKQQFFKQRADWDYLISANPFSTKTFRSCFMYEGDMMEYGYPRNDILYAPDKEQRAIQIREKLNIPTDKKTILYAPTWRDDQIIEKGKYSFKLDLDLDLMKERLGDEYVVLLRTHHYVAQAIDVSHLEGFVYNVCDYDDISELYLISDICITDYSSVFFDYANLKRPILFYVYDFDKYKDQLRGFYIDMNSEVPGPLLYTSEEVIQSIENIDQVSETYKERYEQFYNRFCCYDDGSASEKVAKELLEKE